MQPLVEVEPASDVVPERGPGPEGDAAPSGNSGGSAGGSSGEYGGDELPDGHVRLAGGVSIHKERLSYTFTGSGGPGGQNVNKRATRAVLRVSPADLAMPGWARARVRTLAGAALTDSGEILIACDEHRSQGMNKAECLDRLGELCARAMVRPKIRRKTKPTKGSVERRLTEKKRRSDTKRTRKDRDE